MPFRFCPSTDQSANIACMRLFPILPIALCSLLSVSSPAQEFHCKPCWYGFGKVNVGSSSSTSILLVNGGDKSVRVHSESHQGSAFSFTSLQLPMTLAPGASATVQVVFKPTADGESDGTLTITSSDAAASPMTIQVAGLGVTSAVSSQLTVSPSTLSFGNVNVGSSSSLSATLTATGGSVTIDSDSTNSSEFAISGLQLPLTVPAGKSVQAMITFTPNASGTASGKAGFVNNTDGSPTLEQLTGTGVKSTSSHSADLSWSAGATDITGYNVYRGTTHGGPYSQLNSSLLSETSYDDTSVSGGTTYYYVATEVNTEGQESGYSNEAKAVIPGN
jgi:hypothetical protein